MRQDIKSTQNVSTSILSILILTLLIVFYFYENILRIVPTVVTQDITTIYHLNAKYLGLLVAAFYLTYAPMQLLVGSLLDRYGAKWLLTIAAILCALGIALFGVGDSYLVVFSARLLMGLGASFAFVCAINVLNLVVHEKYFAMMTGVVIAIGVLGSIVGHVLLRYLMLDAGWQRGCFYLFLFGLGLALATFILFCKKNIIQLNVSFTPNIYSFAALKADLRLLLSNRQFWVNSVIAAFFYIPILGFTTTWQTSFLQQVRYFDFDMASNSLLIVFLGWGLGAPFFGWLSQKIKRERLLISLAAAVTTLLLAMIIYVPHLTFFQMHLLLFLFGFCASIHAINFSIAKRLAPKRMLATAIALTNMVIMIGSIIVCLLGVLLDWLWKGEFVQQLPQYSEANYQVAFLVLLLVAFVALILSFFLKESYE